jgi:ribosomal protein S18 acetylase RimI-like enzyme
MKLRYRPIGDADVEYAAECHCRICHCTNNFRTERPDYPTFRAQFRDRGVWDESIGHMRKSLEDARTIFMIAETEKGERVGYLWVVFSDWFEQHMADINDIYVEEAYRLMGIGTQMLSYIEEEARHRGANLLVSGTGVDNVASQAMHKKYGFGPRRFEYQIWL